MGSAICTGYDISTDEGNLLTVVDDHGGTTKRRDGGGALSFNYSFTHSYSRRFCTAKLVMVKGGGIGVN